MIVFYKQITYKVFSRENQQLFQFSLFGGKYKFIFLLLQV